jgi:hypothetical protein
MTVNAILSDEEKSRIRYYLGYPVAVDVSTFTLGIPAVAQTLFILEGQMNKVPEAAVGLVRNCVAVLDGIEAQLVEAQGYFAATRVDSININDRHTEKLDEESRKWVMKLAELLGSPINIYSTRFNSGSVRPINMAVAPV